MGLLKSGGAVEVIASSYPFVGEGQRIKLGAGPGILLSPIPFMRKLQTAVAAITRQYGKLQDSGGGCTEQPWGQYPTLPPHVESGINGWPKFS
jgi:hypothetical protein